MSNFLYYLFQNDTKEADYFMKQTNEYYEKIFLLGNKFYKLAKGLEFYSKIINYDFMKTLNKVKDRRIRNCLGGNFGHRQTTLSSYIGLR
jgi:hypothetical protein